jgi:hypothetical protein
MMALKYPPEPPPPPLLSALCDAPPPPPAPHASTTIEDVPIGTVQFTLVPELYVTVVDMPLFMV